LEKTVRSRRRREGSGEARSRVRVRRGREGSGEAESVLDGSDALLDDLDDVDFRPLFAVLAVGKRDHRHATAVALGVVATEIVEIEVDVEAGAVFGEHDTVAVADGAAGGGDAGADGGLGLGMLAGGIGIDDLDGPEAGQQDAHGDQDRKGEDSEAPTGQAGDFFVKHSVGTGNGH